MEAENDTRAAEELRETVRRLQRANRDLKQAESQLVLQEKLASVGRLAAGIAHEINNPLGFLLNNFSALQDDVTAFRDLIVDYRGLRQKAESLPELAGMASRLAQKEEAAHLDFILEDLDGLFSESREGFARATAIIDSMRNFARSDQASNMSECNINDGIKSTLVLARNEYKYHCVVETDYGDLPSVQCEPVQINQVFLNLLVNAAQAIAEQKRSEKGRIWIRTFMENDLVCCEFSDDGPGMPETVRDKVFEPFFTTKPPGQGTGLGLAISYDIVVNRHGGSLVIDSKAGKGTVFHIRLPMNATPSEEETQCATPEIALPDPETFAEA